MVKEMMVLPPGPHVDYADKGQKFLLILSQDAVAVTTTITAVETKTGSLLRSRFLLPQTQWATRETALRWVEINHRLTPNDSPKHEVHTAKINSHHTHDLSRHHRLS